MTAKEREAWEAVKEALREIRMKARCIKGGVALPIVDIADDALALADKVTR